MKELTRVNEDDRRRSERKKGSGREEESDATDECDRMVQARSIETTESLLDVDTQTRNVSSLDTSHSRSLIRTVDKRGTMEDAEQARDMTSEVQARKRSQTGDDSMHSQGNEDEPLQKRARITSQENPGTRTDRIYHDPQVLMLQELLYCPETATVLSHSRRAT